MMADCQTDVKHFLITTNRPYSCNDLVNNFQNKHNKTSISKALDALVANNEVVEKLNGKQKIYFLNQETLPYNEAQSKELDSKIDQLKTTIETVKKVILEKRQKSKSLQEYVPAKVLEEKLEALKQEVPELKAKLTEMESKFDETSVDDYSKVDVKHTKLNEEWRKRKRLANEMMDSILENYPKSKKIFIEEVGIETDDEMNVRPFC